MLDETRWQLVAWSIAWEGHIGLSRQKGHSTAIQPSLSITQKHEDVLKVFQELIFGVGRIRLCSDGYWRWKVTGQENVRFIISHIIDYLPSERKRQQAKLVLKLCKSRLKHQSRPYSKEEIEIFREYKQIKRLTRWRQ